MKNITILLLAIIVTLFSCHAPVNLMHDSAKMLEKDELKLTGNYGNYLTLAGKTKLTENYGLSIDYGISDKYNMGVHYERINSSIFTLEEEIEIEELTDLWDTTVPLDLNYIRINNKFSLKKDKIAVGLPAEVYFNTDGFLTGFSPHLIFTLGNNRFVESNISPKVNMFFTTGENQIYGAVLPGISIGLGLSSNLDKWAIRPEIGYQAGILGANISWGIGISFNKK